MEMDPDGQGSWEMGQEGKREVLEEFGMVDYFREIMMKIIIYDKKGTFFKLICVIYANCFHHY
jgi:hypothetical protein